MPTTGNGGDTKEDKIPSVEHENKTIIGGDAEKQIINNKPGAQNVKPTLKIREHWGQEKGQIVFTMYQKKLEKKDVQWNAHLTIFRFYFHYLMVLSMRGTF